MGISSFIVRKATKTADKIAKLSSLSPEQLENIQKQRDDYLSEKPDPNDKEAIELTSRLLASASTEIFNSYLPQISTLYSPIETNAEYMGEPFKPDYNICYVNITKWVIDAEENSLEKLINVYEVLSNEECNIGLIFHRENKKTDVFLSVTNLRNAISKANLNDYMDRLINAVTGNFPGSEFFVYDNNSDIDTDRFKKYGVIPCLSNIDKYSVASITNIPTEKSEKFISQTIEKLLDGIIPSIDGKSDYTIILLATPILDIEERKLHLAEIYSGLAPYAGWQTNFTFTDTKSENSMATFGVNVGASAGVQNGQNQSQTLNSSTTESEGTSEMNSQADTSGESSQHTIGESTSTTDTEGKSNTVGVSGSVKVIGINVGGDYHHGWNKSTAKQIGKNIADTIGKNSAQTLTHALTKNLGRALTNGVANSIGTAKNINLGANFGANFARSSNVTATVGKNEGITQSFINYNIKHALEKLEMQMKRLDTSSALGFWDFGAYVISENPNITNNVAHSYLALTQGEESYMSQSAINFWRGNTGEIESDHAKTICKYLQNLRHPYFGIDENIIKEQPNFCIYPSIVTATTGLSGKELSYSLNFPKKSIAGLSVIETAEFGRNISSFDKLDENKTIKLGNIYHMHHAEESEFKLYMDKLTSHTFITGSTGSGKSNTIYKLIETLVPETHKLEDKSSNIHFLVIEPAKGEYKKVFGNRADVSVYSTNSNISPLLRMNPFSFPNTVHVLEHLDRLVSIFNVCWPMYAAMPAVLKNALEKAYEDAGWNLETSINEYNAKPIYPTFNDVVRNIRLIIDSSEYDTENKGAYKGSLITRLQSLTSGLNKQIFSINNPLSDADLFEKNVIIDLSRLGSNETKSLIMGFLILKLQEYYLSKNDMNADLKHITILEEAHNILKRTSMEASSENGNLLGKSVEMIANAIAEMRTYGEAFVIADQSPGLMDMSVIRNTNTKIIMRLPDFGDRELVGKAANLNEKQIEELARLPLGVAAVYQNDWIQPVLCKIDKCISEQNEYIMPLGNTSDDKSRMDENQKKYDIVLKLTSNETIDEKNKTEVLEKIDSLDISGCLVIATKRYIEQKIRKPNFDKLSFIVSSLFPEFESELRKLAFNNPTNHNIWKRDLEVFITAKVNDFGTHITQTERDIVIINTHRCILQNFILNEIRKPEIWKMWIS